VWVVDQEAYDEIVVVVDKEAYDEEICTPGEPIATGYAYKLTGGSPDTREFRCKITMDGTYEDVAVIPGDGVVDACVLSTNPGDDFLVGLFNPKTRFRLYHTFFTEGEPSCEIVHHNAETHEETIHHDEVGHFECQVPN